MSENIFNIDESELAASYAADSSDFSEPESAMHEATILVAYEYGSASSESMAIEFQYETASGYRGLEKIWYIGKNGKTWAVNDRGDKVHSFGFRKLQEIFKVVGVSPTDFMSSAEQGTVKRFGKDERVKIYTAMTGKKVLIGLRKKLEDDYKEPETSRELSEIEVWANTSGITGEELIGKHKPVTIAVWEKRIADKPTVDRRKLSKNEVVDAPFDADAEAALGGWGDSNDGTAN